MNFEKITRQRLKVGSGRIEDDLNGFGMSGGIAADLMLGWILGMAPHVADAR